jgi:hypothetical protein
MGKVVQAGLGHSHASGRLAGLSDKSNLLASARLGRSWRGTWPKLPQQRHRSTYGYNAAKEEATKQSASVIRVFCWRAEMVPEVTAREKSGEPEQTSHY